ncbi:Rep1 [Rhinolophus associated gemykibivirus 1]|uniref:Rep1 n=1 Tax=Rhinolophus associated gemykibivirus 1 TaxID=2004965 RepID=A0A0D3MCF9_9VIRU|nr:Rep1 [Rhinolophus associated gemykibivirus 1]AIF76275.1 Rep1 [Rhinolophus associated gemykibivirus 1]
MTFSFNARYALLTYAQCGTLDPWSVVHHIAELRGECIVAREAHADGGTHLHSFVDFGRKFRSRRTSIFDVDNHHPNVSATHSTPREGFDYACKDGDIVAGGLSRPDAGAVPAKHDRWHDITAAKSREEFFQLLLEHAPRDLCTSFTSLSKYADWMYRDDPAPYKHDNQLESSLGPFPELGSWVQGSINELSVGKSCPSQPAPAPHKGAPGGPSQGAPPPWGRVARGRWSISG